MVPSKLPTSIRKGHGWTFLSRSFLPASCRSFSPPPPPPPPPPDFSIFNNTVFVVSVANTVSQPTVLTPATAQANPASSTPGTATDVGPAEVQALAFTSSTQLSVTVSAAEDSQETTSGNIQGSPSTSASSGVGKRLPSANFDPDNQNLEQQALWFQYGDDAPWWLATPPAQPSGKPETPKRSTPMPGPEDETSLEQSSSVPEAVTLPPQETAQGMLAEPNIWATIPDHEFWAGPTPSLRMMPEDNSEGTRPASTLSLPLLALGAGMVAAGREKPGARRRGASLKDNADAGAD